MSSPNGPRTALVLGGGGVTGIAWEVGVLHGMRAGGWDLLDADLVVGTSAGSVVGVHVAVGTDLDELYDRQFADTGTEIASPVDLEGLSAEMGERTEGLTDARTARRRVGEMAREVDDGLAADRRAAVAARLPQRDWPRRPLRITAVDADTGEVAVFDRSSGVGLLDAVTASCAVPGVWPTVPIDGRVFVDGGAASTAHATLAGGYDRVVVLAPLPSMPSAAVRGLDDEVAEVRAAGADVVVVGPDEEYLAGPGAAALDPAGRPGAAEAGQRFGRRAAGSRYA